MTGFMGLLSLVLPLLIGVINKKFEDSTIRFLISLVICSVIGVVLNVISQNATYSGMTLLEIANSVSESILSLTALTNISYQLIWNNPTVGGYVNEPKKNKEAESPLEQLNLK